MNRSNLKFIQITTNILLVLLISAQSYSAPKAPTLNSNQKYYCSQLLLSIKEQKCYGACWAASLTSLLEGYTVQNKYNIPKLKFSNDALYTQNLIHQVEVNLNEVLTTNINNIRYLLNTKKLFDEGNWFKNSIVLLLRFGLLKEDDYHLPYKSKRDASKNKNRLLKYLERRLKIYYNDVLGLFYEHNKTRDQIQNKFEEIYNAAAIEMNEAIASSLGVVPDLTRKVDSFLLDKEINSVIVKQSLEEPKKSLVEYLFKPTQSTNKSVGPFVPTVENSFYTFKIPDQFSHRKYNINWSEDFMLARANTQMTSYPTEAFSLLIANAKENIPTVISVSWINKFENRKLGLLSLNQKKPIILKSDQLHLHQVLVVGVTTKIENHEEKLDFITIQNSWGEFVGQNGYYRIDAEYLKSYLFEMNWLTNKTN